MTPETKMIEHVNDVDGIVFILFFKMLQYPNFLLGLPMESFFVTYNFECDVKVIFVVVGLKNLTKRAFTDNFEDFVSVLDMVMGDMNVRTLMIVIAVVRVRSLVPVYKPRSFLSISTNKIDLIVCEYFFVLVN